MKRIRTNRRRRMKLKNLIACVTALSVLMGSTYFTMAEDTYICGKEEHTHTADCMECSLEEIHDLTAAVICGSEEHEHVDTCYEVENELTCGKDEAAAEEAHAHDDSCYTEVSVIVCDEEETEGHQHTEGCSTEGELTCGEEETEGHQHDASCEGTETKLTCSLDEKEEHSHDAACYTEVKEKICGSEEHEHEDACYPLAEGSHEHGTDCVMEVACGEEEHTHEDACVKQEVQEEPVTDENGGFGGGSGGGGASDDEEADIPATVQDVIDAAAALPTYDELEANADDDAYMTAFFAQAQPIVQAYLALTDEEKAQVPADIVGLLAIVPATMPTDEPADEDKVAEVEKLFAEIPDADDYKAAKDAYLNDVAKNRTAWVTMQSEVAELINAYNLLEDAEKATLSADDKAVLDVMAMIMDIPDASDIRESFESHRNHGKFTDKLTAAKAAAQTAKEAYALLSDALKDKVTNACEMDKFALVANVDDDVTIGEEVPAAPNDAYVFRYSSEVPFYQYSPHDERAIYMLYDTSKYEVGDTWKPTGGPYDPEKDDTNYYPVYCSDADIGWHYGAFYKCENLEDAGYYGTEEAAHIRAIVMNSYPFISADEMRSRLDALDGNKDGKITNRVYNNGFTDDTVEVNVADIEEAELHTAAQHAIWSYANYYDAEEGVLTADAYGTQQADRSREVSRSYYPFLTKYYESESYVNSNNDRQNNMSAVSQYLTEKLSPVRTGEGEAASDVEIIITNVEIEKIAPTTADGDIFKALVKVELQDKRGTAAIGGDGSDDIYINVSSTYDGNTETVTKKADGSSTYWLTVFAKAGGTIDVTVEGTQELPVGAYFYTAYDKDGIPENGESPLNPGQRESQNFVGVAMATVAVKAADSVKISDDTETELYPTADLKIRKVDAAGTPLTGAEFTLYYVDGNTQVVVETKEVTDASGEITFENLLTGKVFAIKETKAPDGFVAMKDAIKFKVNKVNDETAEIEYLTNANVVNGALQVVNTKGGGGNGGGGGGSDDISVKVEKVWNVPEGTDIPDSIKVDLFRDGDYYDTKTLRAKNNWKATWELDEDFEWTVKEKDVPEGYKVTIDGDMEDGETVTITNTKTSIDPEGGKKTVNVSKVWIGDTEETRPDSIKVQLYKNGIAYGDVVTLNSENWSVAWSDLDKADADGNEIQWTVKEIDVPAGYTASVVETADGTFTLTNTKGTTPNEPTEPDRPGSSDSTDSNDDDGDVLGIDDENVPKGDMVLADEEEVLAAETGDSNHAVVAVVAMAVALAGMFLLRKKKEN